MFNFADQNILNTIMLCKIIYFTLLTHVYILKSFIFWKKISYNMFYINFLYMHCIVQFADKKILPLPFYPVYM